PSTTAGWHSCSPTAGPSPSASTGICQGGSREQGGAGRGGAGRPGLAPGEGRYTVEEGGPSRRPARAAPARPAPPPGPRWATTPKRGTPKRLPFATRGALPGSWSAAGRAAQGHPRDTLTSLSPEVSPAARRSASSLSPQPDGGIIAGAQPRHLPGGTVMD